MLKYLTPIVSYLRPLKLGMWLLFPMIIIGNRCEKPQSPPPMAPKIITLSKDTLFWNVPFTDTVHADSLRASLTDGKTITIHFVDSERGMTAKDSVFSWTPHDTGLVYVNATVCGTRGNCDTLRDTVLVLYAPNSKKRFHFKLDTVPRFVRFIDTLRADSGSIARFGASAFSWHCIDSVKGMVLHDSVFQWAPDDTGPAKITIAQCGPNGRCDTLTGSVYVVNGAFPQIQFRFSADTLCFNVKYTDTLGASRLAAAKLVGRPVSFHLIGAQTSMLLTDSILLWIPRDSGRLSVSLVVGDSAGRFFSIRDTFFIHQCSNNRFTCPSYTHKNDATIGRQSDLPSGFFVYSYEYDPANIVQGLFISDIRKFSPSLVPSTENELPLSIHISDDGKWILYGTMPNSYTSNVYVLSLDGSRKYKVPISGVQVDKVDFYRNGPNGTEICYTTTDTVRQEIFAIKVTLDSVPTFGATRTIADLTGSFRIEKFYPISVAKDQILGAFSLLVQGEPILRMGFLTIPDGGRGIAQAKDMFKWANESGQQVWGCNSTMAHDGSICIYIPGAAGMGGNGGALARCIPQEHRGFVVTPFRRSTDPAITVDDHIDKYGLSINWAPSQYDYGTWEEMDFHGWYLGNKNDLVIGSQTGTQTPYKGVWMVDWKRNVWTHLTPPDSVMPIYWQAVYFTGTDTGNVLNPHYRVVRPNGDEQFTVSGQCTVKVASERDGNAGITITLNNGRYSFPLPGLTFSINPRTDSLFVFTIPEHFILKQYNPSADSIENIPISPVSDSCRICIKDYDPTTGFKDCSDNCFRIIPKQP